MEELITVIMPVYNSEKYLERAIKSVINQTYKKWELICVNDASTDNSLQILKKYESDKIKVKSLEKNSGTAIARNEALKLAKGRYITYLDSDDYYDYRKLEKQIKFMQHNDYAFTCTSYSFINEDGKTKQIIIPQKLTYKEYMKNTRLIPTAIMIDTEKIEKNKLYMENIKIAEDTKTWLRILKKGEIVYGLRENLAYYMQWENSKSRNKIKAAKAVWEIYKEEVGRIKAVYYFGWYAFNACKKRIKKYGEEV